MNDVEFLTEMNHRRARAKELGARWEELNAKRAAQKKVQKTGLILLSSAGGWLSAAGVVSFVLGSLEAAVIFGIIALAAIIGGSVLYD